MKLKTVIQAIFKVLAVVLVLAVLFPSVVKLSHSFTHHSHQVCEDDNSLSTHLHQSDIDCDFYKFKLTESQFFQLSKYEIKAKFPDLSETTEYYISFNNYQQLTRFLRGPPLLV